MKVERILALVHLVLAALYFFFVTFGSWAKRGDPDEGVFSSTGGTGFGYVAVALGVIMLLTALLRLAGRRRVLPGVGVEQLTVVCGIAATLNLIGFVVGWLAVFPTGTGWAIPAAYFPASMIPQLGLLTLSAAEPDPNVQPIAAGPRRTYSVVALLAGVGVALFPFLTWLKSGDVALAAFDGRSGNPTSGPRLAYILLMVGAAVVLASLMRLRPRGLVEPGPNLLLSHALLGLGLIALLLPLATLISVIRIDGLSPGIGLWLGLAAGAVMVAVAVVETVQRKALGA